MTSSRKPVDSEPARLPRADRETSIREREASQRGEAAQASGPSLSLDQRLERKLSAAHKLLAKLPRQDVRANLLHIASLRRDEALLDGILAELATSVPPRR